MPEMTDEQLERAVSEVLEPRPQWKDQPVLMRFSVLSAHGKGGV